MAACLHEGARARLRGLAIRRDIHDVLKLRMIQQEPVHRSVPAAGESLPEAPDVETRHTGFAFEAAAHETALRRPRRTGPPFRRTGTCRCSSRKRVAGGGSRACPRGRPPDASAARRFPEAPGAHRPRSFESPAVRCNAMVRRVFQPALRNLIWPKCCAWNSPETEATLDAQRNFPHDPICNDLRELPCRARALPGRYTMSDSTAARDSALPADRHGRGVWPSGNVRAIPDDARSQDLR